MKTTRTIAGHEITLKAGKSYVATRPMANGTSTVFPVTIYNNNFFAVEHIDGLTYNEANQFLAEFNNGKMSFDGRVW